MNTHERQLNLLTCHNEELAENLNNEVISGVELCYVQAELVNAVCKYYDNLPIEIQDILEKAAEMVAKHENEEI